MISGEPFFHQAMHSKTNALIILLTLLCAVSACVSTPSPAQRLINAQQYANQKVWKQTAISSEPFDLVSFIPRIIKNKSLLTVYFEGDGLAWLNRTTPSSDPTPIHTIGLSLALAHNPGNAAYLARPCQFTGGSDAKGCSRAYWTNKRFSEEVINASNIAVDDLKLRFGAEHLQFIGYSGGGAVAALLAARRTDVIRLVTIGGNLDHELWTKQHGVSPLKGSLNPINYWYQLREIPQIHYIGQYDDIMRFDVANAYRSKFPNSMKPRIVIVPKFDHRCCWIERWPELLPPL